MNLVTTELPIIVSLSRSNLEGLLAQLDDSAADASIMRRTDQGMLIVTAQEDEQHYTGRTPGISGPTRPEHPHLLEEVPLG